MDCKICQTPAQKAKTLVVRHAYSADYYLCPNCGFMFVDNPTWLAKAYEEPINLSDTGYVLRNVYLSRKTLVLFYFLFGTKGNFLDFAGGYGMLARLMRDYGLNFFNDDIHVQNLFARGFEYKHEPITAITCFECFEHLDKPMEDIEKMLAISPNIFFSTVLLPKQVPPPDNWEYYGLDHGQHVAFYSPKTLRFIADKHNLNFYTDGKNLHLITKKKISQAYFRFLLFLSKIQLDLFIRKMLRSKTVDDSIMLRNRINY